MKLHLRIAALIASLCGASMAFASPALIAKVSYVGTYGDGRMFVALDTPILESGCNYNRFIVDPAHPQFKNWMAIAVAAAVSSKSVQVMTSGCAGIVPTMAQTGSETYFILLAN